MRVFAVAAAVLFAGCASLLPAGAPPDPTVESHHDLVRAFHDHGWTTRPVQFVRPLGVVGEGTVYRVQDRTVAVFDYASPEEAAQAAPGDAARLLRLEAGHGVELYRREALLVVTYGRMRTAFDLQLAALLSGPSLAPAAPRARPSPGAYVAAASVTAR